MLGLLKGNTIATLLALLVCSNLFFAPCRAQPPSDQNDANWHFAFDLFEMLLEDRGLQIRSDLQSALAAPKQSVLVVTGSQPAISTNDWRRLGEFVLNGGALLLASDNSISLPGIGQFSKGPVTSNNPDDQYRGFSDCLKIVPNVNSEDFSGVSRIVTNRSGWFVPDSSGLLDWNVLAPLPIDCRPSASRNCAVLSVGRWAHDNGIAVLSADAGLFSNGMMWHGDNAIAAIRVSEMLCDSGTRSQLVFFADGQVLDSYHNRVKLNQNEDVPMPPVPEPELKRALRLANAIAKEVAESNVLNEALKQRPRGIQPLRYFRAFLYLVAILVLCGIIWALISSKALQAVFLAPRTMRSAYEMREHASSVADDFRNSVGYLARDFCWELTGSRNTADWQKYLAALMSSAQTPPKLPSKVATTGLPVSNGSFPNGAILTKIEQHELMRIIDIACRGCHTRISSQEFQLMGNSISKLRGKLRTFPLVAV